MHLRSSARQRWRALVGVALLFGLTGGLAAASLASARRTDSAFPRLLEATRAADISVDYGKPDPEVAASIASLPDVIGSSTYVAVNATPLDAQGHPSTAIDFDFETVASVDGRFFDSDRVIVLSGRLPDPSRADEVAVNESTVLRDGIAQGDHFTLGMVTDEQLEAGGDPNQLVPAESEAVHVVGVIAFTDEVIQDDNDVITRLLTTPAFTAKHEAMATYGWQGLRLRPGVDIDQVSTEIRSIVEPVAEQLGGFILIRLGAEDRNRVDRAILPQVSALLIAALLVAVVAVVLVVQTAVRQIRASQPELAIYRSIGMGPTQSAIAAAAPLLMALGVGAMVAMAVATAASPLSPLGSLHRVEHDPGVNFDAVAVLGGVALLSLFASVGVVLAGLSSTRRAGWPQRSHAVRPSRSAAWLQAAGAPISVTTGVRDALQRQSGPQASAVRSVILGAVVSISALSAALSFGASLDHLIDHPELYGWNWDAAVVDQAGYGQIDLERAHGVLDADPDVAGWAGLAVGSTVIDGLTVPLLGVDPAVQVAPPVLSGRAITGDDEIVLGRSTLRVLGKRVGDTVTFGTDQTLKIVGTASLPAIGQVHSSHPSPGEGGIVSFANIASSAQTGEDRDPASVVVVRFRTVADVASATERLEEQGGGLGQYPGSAVTLDAARPAEIINADSIGIAPTLMAGLLTLAALVSLSLGLIGGVRRRSTDLATLKAVGFTRRQLSAMILTQSFIVVSIGVIVGAPLGILSGRWLWVRFADRLSVVAEPVVPYGVLALVMIGLGVAGLLVAIAPTWIARRIRAGEALRRN